MREVTFNRDGSESIQALLDRIRDLEEERDIFARMLDKRDAECAEQHRVIHARNQRIRELEDCGLGCIRAELENRIRELEEERDIFARTLDKRDAERDRLRDAAIAVITSAIDIGTYLSVSLRSVERLRKALEGVKARKALEGE